MGGRQILDAILVANEVVDSRKKKEEPSILCKLDLEKVYDHVNWEFLDFICKRWDSGVKWRRWINVCISTAKFSNLVNGNPFGFFGSSRGLRQSILYPRCYSFWISGNGSIEQKY